MASQFAATAEQETNTELRTPNAEHRINFMASQIQSEVRAIKKAGNEINKSAKSAREFLRKHGFITKRNKLTRHYR